MLNWVQTLITVFQYLWPFRAVEQWERGVYYFFGRAFTEVGPGRWPVIPYFMDVMGVGIVPADIGSPLLTVTTVDGNTLTFSVAATVQVFDATKAANEIHDVQSTTLERLGALCAARLAEVSPERVAPDNRRRLLGDLKRHVNAELGVFGVRVNALRFTNFGVNLRTFRLLTDTAMVSSGW
jgi:regulator of protease activity HflC (stomatin/prohibitin superfamily)